MKTLGVYHASNAANYISMQFSEKQKKFQDEQKQLYFTTAVKAVTEE